MKKYFSLPLLITYAGSIISLFLQYKCFTSDMHISIINAFIIAFISPAAMVGTTLLRFVFFTIEDILDDYI